MTEDPNAVSRIAPEAFTAFRAAHPDLVFLDALFFDLCGLARGKRLPIDQAGKLWTSGMQIPRTIYMLDARGEMTDPLGRGFGDGDPDGTAFPVPGTLVRAAGGGEPRAQVLMRMAGDDGLADPAEPRGALERALGRFAPLGLTPCAAIELEFYLLDPQRKAGANPKPAAQTLSERNPNAVDVYGFERLDRLAPFLSALRAAAQAQGLPLLAASAEYAPGQVEVNLEHRADILRAADDAVLLRHLVRDLARVHGMEASFMSKPFAGRAGSGMHVHVSLLDRAGRNIFSGEDGRAAIRRAAAGLGAIMHEAMAIFAANPNAYRRFRPNLFVPVNRAWGENNRSVGVRIPAGEDSARRIEHRVAGADANPYLVTAAVLAGIHHGLSHDLPQSEPATGNAGFAHDETVPFTMGAALGELAGARVLPDYLGAEFLALYRASKQTEFQRFAARVNPIEYDWYL